MENNIIVDSCCDMSDSMKKEMNITVVPLIMMLGEREFVDDETLHLANFMKAMKACKDKVGSASPSPYLYACAIKEKNCSFVVTLSGQLSGSYSNAILGKSMAEENNEVSTYVFDSKSASAGQTLIVLKLHKLLSQGLPKEEIISTIHHFIDNMKTYFVLERYDNLQKNGRLNRLTGNIAHILNMRLIMGADGNGNIALFDKPRGTTRMIEKLLSFIEKSGKDTSGENIVISHCSNPTLARRLADAIRKKFSFSNIFIVPTGGVSSLYADEKGIILAF
jgi:DegV family protein with EDD domain